jgi:hypothetical protein
MNIQSSEPQVSLQSLVRLARFSGEHGVSIDALIDRLLASYEANVSGELSIGPAPASHMAKTTSHAAGTNYRYRVDILGKIVTANSLGTLCANVVDAVYNTHPAILEGLSKKGTYRRALLSRTRNGVHLSTPNLPVVQAKCGWWVSSNVSKPQTKRWIETLCEIAGWQLGQQIRLVQI